MTYKVYVTDVLKELFASVGGSVNRRFYDLIKPQKVETRTSEEIISSIKKKVEESVK